MAMWCRCQKTCRILRAHVLGGGSTASKPTSKPFLLALGRKNFLAARKLQQKQPQAPAATPKIRPCLPSWNEHQKALRRFTNSPRGPRMSGPFKAEQFIDQRRGAWIQTQITLNLLAGGFSYISSILYLGWWTNECIFFMMLEDIKNGTREFQACFEAWFLFSFLILLQKIKETQRITWNLMACLQRQHNETKRARRFLSVRANMLRTVAGSFGSTPRPSVQRAVFLKAYGILCGGPNRANAARPANHGHRSRAGFILHEFCSVGSCS